MERPSNSTLERPVLIYDGQCGFCADRVARWRAVTGQAVDYLPADRAVERFPAIPSERLAESVLLVQRDGSLLRGAAAIFAALAEGGRTSLLQLYRRLPGFAWASEHAYRLVARHRPGQGRTDGILGRGSTPASCPVDRRC